MSWHEGVQTLMYGYLVRVAPTVSAMAGPMVHRSVRVLWYASDVQVTNHIICTRAYGITGHVTCPVFRTWSRTHQGRACAGF
eukprot:3157300-Rhodomonas_salina.1